MEAQCFFLCVAIMSVICPQHTTADFPLHAKDEEEERWVQADECFSKAVERVEMRCKDMTEDEQFFLQFDFMNCYLLMMGMDAVLCEERTRQACSVVLNAPEHRLHDNIFEKFYNDLPTLCYHAANALWRKQMGSRVHNLQSLSDKTVRGLLESLQLQEVLEQQQKSLLDNQERILQQGQEISDSVSQQRKAMNSSFTHLHGNLTDQASVLRAFGSQLKSSLDRIHTALVFVLGGVTGGIEVYVLLLCVVAMVTCLSATRQTRGTLRWTVWLVAAEIAVEMVLRMFLGKETLMVVVSLCRQLAVCAALLLYLVLLLRRLLLPRVEDYDTELLIGRLSHQVQDMEARLQASGLLPSEHVISHPPPLLASSPLPVNGSVLPDGSTWEEEIPLPQPRDTSGSPFTPIQFNEESGRMDDGGYEEVDTHADQSSVDGLAKEERGEKERQLTRWSMVGDNKLAEEEEVEKRNGKVARGKDSGGSKKKSVLPKARRSVPPRTTSDIAEDDTTLWSVSQRRYNLRTRKSLHPSSQVSPQPMHHSEEALDEFVGGSQSHRRLNRSPLAARVVKSGGTELDTIEQKRHSSTTRTASTSTRKSKPRHSML